MDIIQEEILNALEDFIEVAEQHGLKYGIDDVIDVLRGSFTDYVQVMTYLYEEYGINDD